MSSKRTIFTNGKSITPATRINGTGVYTDMILFIDDMFPEFVLYLWDRADISFSQLRQHTIMYRKYRKNSSRHQRKLRRIFSFIAATASLILSPWINPGPNHNGVPGRTNLYFHYARLSKWVNLLLLL